jgi:hypothetical protein
MNNRELPYKKNIPIKETMVEIVSWRDVKTTCHFMKCLHSTVEPALEKANGDKYWYRMGLLHRDGGPAVTQAGDEFWYINEKLHREDGPAIIRKNGTKEWYINNKRHREDGPAVTYKNGNKEYWKHDIRQR